MFKEVFSKKAEAIFSIVYPIFELILQVSNTHTATTADVEIVLLESHKLFKMTKKMRCPQGDSVPDLHAAHSVRQLPFPQHGAGGARAGGARARGFPARRQAPRAAALQ